MQHSVDRDLGIGMRHAVKDAALLFDGRVSDFEFEFQLALMNRKLDKKIETIFMMPKDTYTFLSSRMVKEIARLGGDIGAFVPQLVESTLKEKFFTN